MKLLILFIIFIVHGFSLCAQTRHNLNGEYSGAQEGGKVYLGKQTDNKKDSFIVLDSASFDSNCKFTFGLDNIEADKYQIRFAPFKLDLFIDGKSDIYVKVEKEFQKTKIISNQTDSLIRKFENTNMNVAFAQILFALTNKQYTDKGLEMPDSLLQQNIQRIEELNRQKSNICKEALENPGYPLAYIALNGGLDEFSVEELDSAYLKMDDKIKTSLLIKDFKNLVTKSSNLSKGGFAPDFSSQTLEGKEISLYSFISNKKIVLIDFWASWCSPCRKENKNVLKIYNRYKNDGFDIISISLDSNPEKWKEAIILDKLEWTHVSNLEGWNDKIAKLYNVTAVPSSFLVDCKGKIIATNLRGDNLEKVVSDIID